jgi:hypothetical protein
MTSPDEVRQSIRRIQEFPAPSLARQDLEQPFSFSTVVEPAEKLIRLYGQITLSTIDDLPDKHLDTIKKQADADFQRFEQILNFDPMKEGSGRTRDTLIQQLRDGYQATFDQIHMFISYGASIKPRDAIQPAAKDIAITAVKWLIPSMSALMVILGYVAESAHQALLGFDFGNLGTTEYIWASGAIVRDIVLLLVLALFNDRPFFPAIDFETVFGTGCVILCFFMFALVREAVFPTLRTGSRHISLLVVVGAITLVRVAAVDLPLTRIENVLVSGTSSVEKLLSESPAANVPAVLTRYASALYEIIVCARNPTVSTKAPPIHCKPNGMYWARLDRIVGITALSALIVAGFGIWLFFNSSYAGIAVGSGLLVIYSVFALPYAYGKLKRSTEYEYAVVQLKTAILDPPGAEVKRAKTTGIVPLQARAHSTKTAASDELRLQPAMILVRGERFVKLYVDHRVPCPSGKMIYEWRFWEGSLSEIVLLREIQRKDVIELKFSKGSPGCEPIESP